MNENELNKKASAENPTRFLELKVVPPKLVAAGIPGVYHGVKSILGEMPVFRAFKALHSLNQKQGYDCPGCAWPDPDGERSSIGEYCENGIKAIAEEATTKKITADFFSKNSVFELGKLSDYEIGKLGRIAEPLFLRKGATNYESISWEKALNYIAQKLKECPSPDRTVFYTSGRTSNEAAFLYQLLVRQYGTNNLPDCSNMCHESSGVALTETLGIGKGSVTLEDFYQAEVIIILGQNPGTNHPRMLSALKEAKKNGCQIIAINPLKETGLIAFNDPQSVKGIVGLKSVLSDIYLQVKINGDMALLQAIEKIMLEKEEEHPGQVFDQNFIENKTEEYEQFCSHLKNLEIEKLISNCGISKDQIEKVAELLSKKNKIIACWAMGLTQHKNAVDTIKEIVNLLLLKGSLGKPGAGTCPVRGHSNVQGDRTMGIYEKPSDDFLQSIEKNFHFTPPSKHGYDTVASIHAMDENKVDVFIAMGGNFISATPDTIFTAQAMRKCKLTVQISTKLNRSHLITGEEAIILPVLSRSDKDILNNEQQFVTTENSMGVVQMSKGNLDPISTELKSEPTLISELALKLFHHDSSAHWKNYIIHYDFIRNDIARTIPGFENFNQKVRKLGGFYLPNSTRERNINLESGKAPFTISEHINQSLEEGELMLMTIRSHDQFNTTIYGLDDRYRGVLNERRVIFMNEKDIVSRRLTSGTIVDIYNFHNGKERVARQFKIISYDIPESCCATYFPEANVLVPIDSTADKSNTPTSKLVKVVVKEAKA